MGYSFWKSFLIVLLYIGIELEGGCTQEVQKVLDGRYELIHEYTKQGGVGKNLKN